MVLMYFNKSQQRNKDKNIPIGKQGHLTWMLEGRDAESLKTGVIFESCKNVISGKASGKAFALLHYR